MLTLQEAKQTTLRKHENECEILAETDVCLDVLDVLSKRCYVFMQINLKIHVL